MRSTALLSESVKSKLILSLKLKYIVCEGRLPDLLKFPDLIVLFMNKTFKTLIKFKKLVQNIQRTFGQTLTEKNKFD